MTIVNIASGCMFIAAGCMFQRKSSKKNQFHMVQRYQLNCCHISDPVTAYSYTLLQDSLLLFQYPFYPCVTAVACKRSWSFCQKCRWQVTAKHAYTLRMWLCMMRHGAWLYGVHRTCTETPAVPCGTSHASA